MIFKKVLTNHPSSAIIKSTQERQGEPDKKIRKIKEGGMVQWYSQNLSFNMRVVLHSSSPLERPFKKKMRRGSSSSGDDDKQKVI